MFDGTWTLDIDASRLAGPAPKHWIQHIEVTAERVRVREDIVLADGTILDTSVDAGFDGAQYPVHGWPTLDTIAYMRVSERCIAATAKRGGHIAMTETVKVSNDGHTLTHEFAIRGRAGGVANSVAVFTRAAVK